MGVNYRGAKGAAAPLVHLRGGSAPLGFLPCLQIMFYVFFYLRMSFRKSIAISNDDVMKHDNISTKVTVADTGFSHGGSRNFNFQVHISVSRKANKNDVSVKGISAQHTADQLRYVFSGFP